MTTQKPAPDELHRQAQLAALQALDDGADAPALLAAVGTAHQPEHFTPDVALLELAATALGLATRDGQPMLAYEGLRERYLPEVAFSGRVEHRNSQYALYANACLGGGLEPDLLNDCGWWRTPLYVYAAYALLIYSRAAADRRTLEVTAVVTLVREAHAL